MAHKIPLKHYFTDQLWASNQVLVAILGICSALGITNKLEIAITMGLAVTFVTAFSSLFVSLLRSKTPDSVRMIAQLAIISLFVTTIDQFLKAYFYPLSKVMTVFVGLIITNCIVMGRAESMAKDAQPMPAFFDGLGAGLGYMWVICTVGVFRELFGFGTLLGHQIIPISWYASLEKPELYSNINLMITPPAAFFILGFMIWITNTLSQKKR